jgi:hypothetical protein
MTHETPIHPRFPRFRGKAVFAPRPLFPIDVYILRFVAGENVNATPMASAFVILVVVQVVQPICELGKGSVFDGICKNSRESRFALEIARENQHLCFSFVWFR